MEWWEQSLQGPDPAEQIMRLLQQLSSTVALADSCQRPLFLRALGRDLEMELQDLANRTDFGVGKSGLELTQRRKVLEEMVDYYYEAVVPWMKAARAVELSDCVREAVAGLSADMVLILRVEGEPAVVADRCRLISLCELAIRAATAHTDDDVEVVLPPCSADHAELLVLWTRSTMSPRESRDKARFLALAVAYAIKLGGALRRTTRAREGLVLQIPLSQSSDDEAYESSVGTMRST
jgi:hypothetical protein